MNNKTQVQYYTKTIYGNEYMYLADQKLAEAVSKISGKKTINNQELKALELIMNAAAVEVLPPRK